MAAPLVSQISPQAPFAAGPEDIPNFRPKHLQRWLPSVSTRSIPVHEVHRRCT